MNNVKTISITADFSQSAGAVNKMLHCSNYMPCISQQNILNFNDAYAKMHFTAARTHDQALTNAGQRVVDTHFVFPLFDADADDEKNYYFPATDYLLQNTLACGTHIYYRLGTSIEHTLDAHHFNTNKPSDFVQYAKILAGIIRHYNYGWADGYKLNIPIWEIWNEPDIGKKCWNGTQEEFIDFFCTVLTYLKKEFPAEKIGGPALCYANKEYLIALLTECKKRNITPDFISWHAYWYEVAPLIKVVFEMRELLDNMGFTETKLHLNEWHYLKTWDGILRNVTPENYQNAMFGESGMHGCDSAAYNAALFIGFHDSPLECSCYYGAGNPRNFGAFGLHDQIGNPDTNYYSMTMIGDIVHNYTERFKVSGVNDRLWAMSVLNADKTKGAMLISDCCGNYDDIEIELQNLPSAKDFKCILLDMEHHDFEIPVEIIGNKLKIRKKMPCSTVFLLTFNTGGI